MIRSAVLGQVWRRGGGAKGSGKGAAPRPPQLHRRHEPCTLTNPLTPPEFVDHLKTINWYKQQARIARSAPESCSFCDSLVAVVRLARVN